MAMSYQHCPVQNSKVAKRGSATFGLVRSFQPPGAAGFPAGTTAVSSAMRVAAGRRASSMRHTWLNEVSGAGKPAKAPVAPVAAEMRSLPLGSGRRAKGGRAGADVCLVRAEKDLRERAAIL